MLDEESEQPFLEKRNSGHQGVRRKISKTQVVLYFTQFLTLFLLPVAYFLGHRNATCPYPLLPTDVITKNAVQHRLQRLDDGLQTDLADTFRYKGQPRPELNRAWDELYKHMNVRVHSKEVEKSNFSSVVLDDGSGDLYGAPVVFHNLHCLKTLRQTFFPEAYPEAAEHYKSPGKGMINEHVDHCLDNLRQAIMCQGDMSLYSYKWLPGKKNPYPVAGMEHVCVDWDKLQAWAEERYFDVETMGFVKDSNVIA